MEKLVLIVGSLNMALAIALGAFGAHGLKQRISPDLLAVYETGVSYHVYHALGLVAVGLTAMYLSPNPWVRSSAWFMMTGIVLFSGSLYALSLTGIRKLGMITPVGGVAFIVAWVLLAVGVLRSP